MPFTKQLDYRLLRNAIHYNKHLAQHYSEPIMNPSFDIKQYLIKKEPYYQAQANEVVLYEAAYAARRF